MSVMDKIFGAFGANQPAQQPTNQPNNQQQLMQPAVPGNIPANPTQSATPGNPTTPSTSAATMDEAAKNPLDQYTKMWEVDPNAPAKKPEPSIFANVTPEALAAAAKKNDFTGVLTPEIAEAIKAGGDGANAALIQVMNAMSQKGFADSAFASTKLIEQALEKQQAKFEAMLPSLIKNQTVNESLRSANPLFNHPAASPMLDAMKTKLLEKHPQASAAEITEMAQNYLIDFAKAGTPAQKQIANKSEVDWDQLMG